MDNTMPMGGVKAFKDASSIATWLHSAGYRTGLFGKYLNEYELSNPYFVPPGWDDWRGGVNAPFQTLDYNYSLFENGVLVPYGSQPQDYGPDVLSAKIVKFIEATPTGQPLFAYFAPQNYTPANVDIGTFSSFPPIRLPSFNEADVSDKPVWVQKLAPLTASQISIGDGDVRRSLESLQSVDRGIASIIDALKRTGRYNNTVIVLTSDNGMSYGEHRWSSKKWCVYEECIRAPLWVRVPGVPGRMENNLTVNVDFAPTFSEWAGAIPQTKVDGLSMATLFKNASSTWPTERLVEYLGVASGGSALLEKSFHAVRTPQSVYAEYDNGDKEFYDLVTDPYQMDNVVNNLNYTTTISNLKKVLDAIKGL
ncbi:MAG: sulfatase-like hydrolase/transferase [Candidatus Doudnabacteria bacterium]|nr:sulfatase-like hydrolase/transferase [Candidatus Doudnabacteria bacterium]